MVAWRANEYCRYVLKNCNVIGTVQVPSTLMDMIMAFLEYWADWRCSDFGLRLACAASSAHVGCRGGAACCLPVPQLASAGGLTCMFEEPWPYPLGPGGWLLQLEPRRFFAMHLEITCLLTLLIVGCWLSTLLCIHHLLNLLCDCCCFVIHPAVVVESVCTYIGDIRLAR